MLYLYDKAICEDLIRSFNPDVVGPVAVQVVDPEGLISLAAQIQEDKVKFPLVSVYRDPDTPIDRTRTNFTRMHRGVQSVIDPNTNELYYEKVIPIKLSYKLTLLTTNTYDMDELVRELLFKYTNQYFLSIKLPYECNRVVRFGVVIDPDIDIDRKSGSFEYISSGQLHQTVIPIRCEGCVLVNYTPAKLRRVDSEVNVVT